MMNDVVGMRALVPERHFQTSNEEDGDCFGGYSFLKKQENDDIGDKRRPFSQLC